MVVEELSAQLNQLVDQQQVLLGVTRHIARGMGLSEMIPHILGGIDAIIRPDGIRLLLSDAERPWQPYGAGPLSDMMAPGDAQVLALVNENGAFEASCQGGGSLDVSFLPPEIANVVAVPLMAHDLQHGIVWLGFGMPYNLDESERAFLFILAGQAAIAIANARAFAAARKRREWLAAVLSSTPDPVLVVDRDLHLQLVNPAAQETFPTLTRESLGIQLDSLPNMADLVALFRMENGDRQATAMEYDPGNGRMYAPNISDVRTESGEMTGWVLILRDISHFKRLNDNMSEFLSTVSHDMRSPLTFMKGYLDMIGMVGDLNEKQHDFVEKTAAGVVQMSDMVEKILEAGKLDPVTGTYQLLREASDIVEIFNKVTGGLVEPASKKNLAFESRVTAPIPILNVDRAMLSSAFTNLVENAVKYTPEGGRIEVELGVKENDLLFRVTDNGYGIRPEDQKKLFERNVRIHRREWKRVKGSGLGLFIVKNVAQRHGGDAWVESTEGAGSTFYLSIPLEGANMVGAQTAAQSE